MNAILAVAVWALCGCYAYRLEKQAFPTPVIPAVDAMLSAVLVASGPCGLIAIVIYRLDRRRGR